MPEIGATLREARMRARIDIAEIETATKIRAKYLRALENEEWDLLPGPTFVKTFLRTYAEALGLDAKLLVDEYKLRHERLSDQELRPISPRSQAAAGGRGGRGPGRRPAGSMRGGGGRRSARGPITIVLVLAILGILALIGALQDDAPDRAADAPRTTATQPAAAGAPTSTGTAPATRGPRTPARAALRIQPTGDVEVCLRGRGRSRPLVDGVILQAGEDTRTFRSSRFTIRLGNNNARLRWNGKSFRPPASAGPIGYAFTRTGRVRLPADQLPSCG
jgi:cytoskeleton protein RodZ